MLAFNCNTSHEALKGRQWLRWHCLLLVNTLFCAWGPVDLKLTKRFRMTIANVKYSSYTTRSWYHIHFQFIAYTDLIIQHLYLERILYPLIQIQSAMIVCVLVCVCARLWTRAYMWKINVCVFVKYIASNGGSGERGKGIKSKISLNGAYIQIIFKAGILHGIHTKNNEMPFKIIDLFECCSLVMFIVKKASP